MKKIIPFIICIGLITSLFSEVIHTAAETVEWTVTIQADDVNIRNGPGTDHAIVEKTTRGSTFSFVSEQGEWFEVMLQSGNTGWVANWLATKSDATGGAQLFQTGIVMTDILNVRASPSLQANVIGKLQIHSEITIISQQDEWFEILLKETTGWINKEFITVVTTESKKSGEQADDVPADVQGTVGTITASTLNVHKKNTMKSKVVGTVTAGQHVEIVEEQDSWVKIEYKRGKRRKHGWVAGWFVEKAEANEQADQRDKKSKKSAVTILHDETNIREAANGQAPLVQRVKKGDTFPIVRKQGDWYEIKLPDKKTAFVAGWLVATDGPIAQVEKPGIEKYLKNKTIVIDPGHGGNDQGTTGAVGSIEKQMTLKASQIIASKLRDAGAHVVLTRTTDSYVSLPARVSKSNHHQTDAFLSIHFDSMEDATVQGMTSYYYYDFQKRLAESVHGEVVGATKLKSRDARYGDYYVLRENFQHAVLLELGYVSNPVEEAYITTTQFQEAAADGIYNGLARYFRD